MLFSVNELLKFTNNLRKANEKVILIYLLVKKIGDGKTGGSTKCCQGCKEPGILMHGWLEYKLF